MISSHNGLITSKIIGLIFSLSLIFFDTPIYFDFGIKTPFQGGWSRASVLTGPLGDDDFSTENEVVPAPHA